MRTSALSRGWLGRTVLALAALVALAAMAGPASAHDNGRWRHHRHYHDRGFFSFGFGAPGYYYAPPPRYYYPPPGYYYPPPGYYYPPPAYYYAPGPSFNLVIPFHDHH